METPTHAPVTASDIKIALLENNELIFEKMTAAIEKSSKTITTSVDKKTDGFIGQIATLAKNQGADEGRITALENKLDRLWSKIILLITISNIIVGGVVYLVVGGHVGH